MRLAIKLLSLTVLGLVACDDDGGVLPLDRYCEAATIACPDLAACCEARGFVADVTTCEVSAVEACHARLDEAAAAGASYDAEAGAQCMDGYWAWVARCDAEAPAPAACAAVFVGPEAPTGLPAGDPAQPGVDSVCTALFPAD